MHTPKIFEYLKQHGQLLDFELAAATGIPLYEVRAALAELSAQGEISRCRVTRYVDGKPREGFQCRLVGYSPPLTPQYGRDSGSPQRRPWNP